MAKGCFNPLAHVQSHQRHEYCSRIYEKGKRTCVLLDIGAQEREIQNAQVNMESLRELVSVCRAADTDKITERKKQIEKLQLLLNKGYIVKALDKNSDSKMADPKLDRKLFGWDSLFKMTRNLIWREAESLQKAKNSQSATSQKKKQEICGLLKLIVRLADKRGQRLKGQEVVSHILSVMKDDFTRAAFGADHTSILLKNILCVRKYWCELSQTTWHELLHLYSGLLQNPPPMFDRVVMARIVHLVIMGTTKQCDIQGKDIIPILKDYFENIKQERSIAVQEHMLSALNTLLLSMAIDCRLQICRLGETIFIPLLYLWNHRPSDKLKNELIQFYQLQMCAHHPSGAQSEQNGAFAVNWELWKASFYSFITPQPLTTVQSHLRKLYESLYNDLQEMGGRNRFSTGSRETNQCELPQNFVTLAASVCHQLFLDKSSAVDVTQVSFLQEPGTTQPGGVTKKRKIESGWGVLRDAIASQGQTYQVIPWLQLLDTLLYTYPLSLPEEEHCPTLSTLQHLLSDCKKLQITRWCLQSLRSLAVSQTRPGRELTDFTTEQSASLWQKVWASTLRLISLHHASDHGYKLLCELLRNKLVVPDKDVWNLFIPNLSTCSESGLLFLALYLQHYDLPESYQPQYLVTMATESVTKFPLRSQLLDWLLPILEDTSDAVVISRKEPSASSLFLDTDLLTECLITLTKRDTRMVVLPEKYWTLEKVFNSMGNTGRNSTGVLRLEDIEEVYQQSSFAVTCIDKDPQVKREDIVHSGSQLVSIEKKLFALLERDAQHWLEVTEPEVKILECMTHSVCLYTKLLTGLLQHNSYTSQQITQLQLYDYTKEIFLKVSLLLAESLRKDGLGCLEKIVLSLQALVIAGPHSSDVKSQTAALHRSLIPAELTDRLLGIIKEKQVKLGRSVSSVSTQSASRRVKASAFDDLDDDFGFEDTSTQSTMDEEFDDDFDDMKATESQDSDGFSSIDKGEGSLLSIHQLSDSERVKLGVVSFLCSLCQYPTGQTAATIKSELLDLLEEEKGWDPTKAYDLQLMKIIMEDLTQPSHDVTEDDLECFLEALRAVCKFHRKDQDICQMVLSHLSIISGHLTPQDNGTCVVSESIKESRQIALTLLGVFWKLCTDNKYGKQTRNAVVQCMHAFVKNDPRKEWTFLKPKPKESGEPTLPQYLCDLLTEFLKDKHHGIRLIVAKYVKSLFGQTSEDGKLSHLPAYRQDEAFDLVYSALQELMRIEGHYSSDEMRDEANNRTSSLLYTLAHIACHSPVCEKKALFAVCQMSKDRSLEVSLVGKVLLQIARYLGYEDHCSFIKVHLPYLVKEWLDSKYDILDFPYKIMGYNQKNAFIRENYTEMVPLLLVKKNNTALKSLATCLSMDISTLFRESGTKVLVHILPMFAVSKQNESGLDQATQRKVAVANECYENFTKVLPHQEVEKLIMNNMDEIVVEVLMTLHEEKSSESHFIRDTDPEPNPPCFNRAVITCTLQYLSKGHNDTSLISALVKHHQDGIQKILLYLSQHLSETHRYHEKCRVMMMYRLFVEMLMHEFHQQLGGSWAFVLRDVLHTLVHNINSTMSSVSGVYHRDFVLMCLDVLYLVCQIGVEMCAEELSRFLSTIVSVLVPLADRDDEIRNQSQKVVNFLLVENAQQLKKPISLLDPLPQKDGLRNAREIQKNLKYANGAFSLRQEVQHFLQAGRGGVTHCSDRKEGLKFLAGQLAAGKHEIPRLLQDCQKKQCGSELIHLVHELIHLTKSKNKAVAEEAGRCLGEIGPVDLDVIAIRGPAANVSLSKALQKYKEHPNLQRYCQIFHLLDEYLIDSSIELVCASSEVLKKLLSTRIGMAFYKDYKTRVGDHLFQYLHPFKSTKSKGLQLPQQDTSEERFRNLLGDNFLWIPDHGDHKKWIKLLTCKLIESGGVKDEILRLLTPICTVQAKFCEQVLPYLIHNILANGTDFHRSLLSAKMDLFFAKHCGSAVPLRSTTSNPLKIYGRSESPVYYRKESVETMLGVVQYLRQQDVPSQGKKVATAWDNNFWLEIDYLQAARAALNCSAYFTTILYAEIWCNIQREKMRSERLSRSESQNSQNSQVMEQFSQNSHLESLATISTGSHIQVQELILEAYRCISDPDGVYGTGAGTLADTDSRIKTYEHENEWEKAVSSYDVLLSQPSTADVQTGLMQALQNLGTSHVLKTYLTGVGSTHAEDSQGIKDMQYQLALSNCHWDLDVPTRLDDKSGFYETVYGAVISLKDRDLDTAERLLKTARSVSLNVLEGSSLESTRSIYPSLSQLHCVSMIEGLCTALDRKVTLQDLLQRWETEDSLFNNSYEFVSPVLSQRCSLLELLSKNNCLGLGDSNTKALVQDNLVLHLQKYAKFSREAGRHQCAERVLYRLRAMDNKSPQAPWSWRVEEARMFWSRGEHDTAKYLMKKLSSEMAECYDEDQEASVWYPQTLEILGNWLAETRSENPSVVMEQYLSKAVELTESHPDVADRRETAVDAYLSLARYADSQYQNIVNYMKSGTYEAKLALIKKAKEDIEKLKKIEEKSSRYLRILQKQQVIDEHEAVSMLDDRQRYLMCAIKNYLKCLDGGDKHDLRVFRLTSLWFDNSQDKDVNCLLQSFLPQLKSYKFLSLMYQLAARLSQSSSNSEDLFQPTLDALIYQTTLDHPHHCLFIILALAHANKDKEITQSKSSRKLAGKLSKSASSQDSQLDEERVSAAKSMIDRLRQSERGDLIQDMEQLCVAYIQLANFNVDQHKKETRPINLPSSLQLTKLSNLSNIAMPTMQIDIDPKCEYQDVVTIEKFEPTFKLAGGINLPKIITCVGSDGVSRRQLVKGKDDLRQDAVMQQVFGMVNNLLSKEHETHRRKLKVRTYKVIPLSQVSGLLEWCEGTIPMGEYLIGSNAAHVRYRPTDYKAIQCRQLMNKAHSGDGNKAKTFLNVCKNFQPVLRHFFLENFLDPAEWFQRQQAYTRSVATNSIVGYILGLGDRHVQNILIDCETAELIHIDLGVAFEQGRILPTPETVPFRLTRDIVDGMGVAGVEGVFRRCCEKTMEVMRQNQEALLTILQVLLYDPLYAWTISPEKAILLQQMRDPDVTDVNMNATGEIIDMEKQDKESGENVNKVAERVLLRLHQKLQGIEDSVQLSVSGQVNLLIQEARDPYNLCKLFPGWQAYI